MMMQNYVTKKSYDTLTYLVDFGQVSNENKSVYGSQINIVDSE